MGKIKNNAVTRGFSGKLGEDLVFRQVDNKTVFSKRTLSSKPASAEQLKIRTKFTEAAYYASAAMDNEQAAQDYQFMADLVGLKSAYVAAVTDFLTPPEIASVFAANYLGAIGDVINIKPKLANKIIDLNVTIFDANGNVVESGKGVTNGEIWRYKATVPHAEVVGSKIVIVGRDRQRRETTFEQAL